MSVQILKGDCREVLRTLAADSVQCVVTSPPYWGLRDYGIPPSIWGGDPDCEHQWGDEISVNDTNHTTKARWQFCQHCNAWAGAFGLEPTYQLYVEHSVEVFSEVRRVLRPDGTLWLNLGDSYCSGGRTTWRSGASANKGQDVLNDMPRPGQPSDLKPKDLIGIPWRVAFALQADGWWLRQDVIWAKPNPMPESVTDRCTKAHEYLFLMTKSERYIFDADAIAEPIDTGSTGDYRKRKPDNRKPFTPGQVDARGNGHDRGGGGQRTNGTRDASMRNKRSVWTVPTAPFAEAHFATFPPSLIEPCILAGCPKGGTVLDPFGGAGTTGLVADRLGRSAVMIELNPEYAAMADRRIKGDGGMFASVTG